MKRFNLYVIAVVLVVVAISASTVNASAFSDIQYQVQPGDNLIRIASRYHMTVKALLQENPKITNPNLIFPGEKLLIPVQAEFGPAVSISPDNGSVGTPIHIVLNGFPAKTNVELGIGKPGAEANVFFTGQTDSNGTLTTQKTIPASASGETWIVVATAVQSQSQIDQVISNIFTVTKSEVTSVSTNYIVKPDDELSLLADKFGTTVSAILAANPSIHNPNQIFVGQRLFIPGAVNLPPMVVIAPIQGEPITQVKVMIGGFPSNTPVEIKIGKKGDQMTSVETRQTDENGNMDALAPIPASASSNDQWVVEVNTTDGSGVSVKSNPLIVAGQQDEPETGNEISYIVKSGDNLSKVSFRFGSTVSEILEDNPKITNPNLIYVGERLYIPVGTHM